MTEDQSSIYKKRRGVMFVLSSPSGAGKTSLCQALLKKHSSLKLSISMTTRQPRPKEKEGSDYYFVTQQGFEDYKRKNMFLETAHVFGHQYGTPKRPVENQLEKGCDVLFDIDWQGAQQLSQMAADDLVKIFILPPGLSNLEQRLKTRAEDQSNIIKNRMKQAMGEMSHWAEYDYILINDLFDETLMQIETILKAERKRRHRQFWIQDFIRGMTG